MGPLFTVMWVKTPSTITLHNSTAHLSNKLKLSRRFATQ